MKRIKKQIIKVMLILLLLGLTQTRYFVMASSMYLVSEEKGTQYLCNSSPRAWTTSYVYDKNGLVHKVLSKGPGVDETTTYSYDKKYRVTKIVTKGKTEKKTGTYKYDGQDRITKHKLTYVLDGDKHTDAYKYSYKQDGDELIVKEKYQSVSDSHEDDNKWTSTYRIKMDKSGKIEHLSYGTLTMNFSFDKYNHLKYSQEKGINSKNKTIYKYKKGRVSTFDCHYSGSDEPVDYSGKLSYKKVSISTKCADKVRIQQMRIASSCSLVLDGAMFGMSPFFYQ